MFNLFFGTYLLNGSEGLLNTFLITATMVAGFPTFLKAWKAA